MKLILALFALGAFAFAKEKDKEISLQDCPPPVKATIAEYSKKFTFEKVELEGKDGKVYGAKFTSPNGHRFEIIMGDDGKVQKTELKKPKDAPKEPKEPKAEKEKAK